MKKFYFLASALLAVTTLKAQTTVDFEELTLPAVDTFYNGSDEAGGFTSNGVTFNNFYNTQFDSWSGFAYSNLTDNTTAGFGNQHSAFAGSGANGSEKYAVYYNSDTLFLPGNAADLTSADLTNNTYAGISMRDGDAFAKQFGSVNDASGDSDGTNGEDFFFVRIYSHDNTGNKVDSVDSYLADYRFADDADDYIVKQWETVDLSTLTAVNFLTFKFFSSDVGDFGVNTPQYFALDDFVYTNTTALAEENALEIGIYPNPATSTLHVKGESGQYTIYSTNGATVIQFNHTIHSTVDVSTLEPGIYFVKGEVGKAKKLIIQ